jgi:methylated-DNA-[protein]-cysteine S-methyltransferase
MTMERYSMAPSPLGKLLLVADGDALVHLLLPGATPDPAWRRDDAALADARAQLEGYFAGTRQRFELRLAPPGGTPFERRVWAALLDIPYGEVVSYGELADRVGAPRAARAVGQANGRNPIAIIVPCHRVVAAGGKLGGYGGGLPAKRALLDLERRGRA